MANAELAKEQLEQRRDTFISTLKLAEDLCGLSAQLSRQPQEGRQGALRAGIRRVSDGLVEGHPKGTGVMFPMGNDVARVVRLPAEEAVLLNSREKAPYLVFLEVIHAIDDDTASVPSSGPASFSSLRDSPSTPSRWARVNRPYRSRSRHPRRSRRCIPVCQSPAWADRITFEARAARWPASRT